MCHLPVVYVRASLSILPPFSPFTEPRQSFAESGTKSQKEDTKKIKYNEEASEEKRERADNHKGDELARVK